MIPCPLCCGQEFRDTVELASHLTSAYKRLKCPLCNIRFDNLMVMIKHLERGGCFKDPKNSDNVGSASEETDVAKPSINTDNVKSELTEVQFADDSDNEADINNTTTDQGEEVETISEDQYLDKNGQLYRRRVVKISNLWETDSSKPEQERSKPRPKVPYGSAECPLCFKVFKGQHSLRLHLEVAHRGQTHTCVYCHRVFQSEGELNEHVHERHSMPYSCVYCNKLVFKVFKGQHSLRLHLEVAHRGQTHTCVYCHRVFQSEGELNEHVHERHSMPYSCVYCNKLVFKVFKGQHSLRLHLEVAHRGQTHTCVYCHRVFQSEGELNEHVHERHSMPYSCVYCNKPFNNLALAKKHVECHKDKKKAPYACELCPETATSSAEIKRHYKDAHVQELQPRDAPTLIAPYKKGSLWYEWRGYTYHQTGVTRAGVQVLKCWVDGCWAEVRVPVIGSVASQGTHSHPPYEWLKERNEMYNVLRRRCMTETTPIRIIYDEEAYRYPLGAQNLPYIETSLRMWQRKGVQGLAADRDQSQVTLQDEGNQSWSGNNTNDESMLLPDIICVEPTKKFANKRKAS